MTLIRLNFLGFVELEVSGEPDDDDFEEKVAKAWAEANPDEVFAGAWAVTDDPWLDAWEEIQP